jgi:hypothetical protein
MRPSVMVLICALIQLIVFYGSPIAYAQGGVAQKQTVEMRTKRCVTPKQTCDNLPVFGQGEESAWGKSGTLAAASNLLAAEIERSQTGL